MGPAPSQIRPRERAHDDDAQTQGLSEAQGGFDELLAEVSPANLRRDFRVENREGLWGLPIVQEGRQAVDRQLEPAALGVVRTIASDDPGTSPTRTPVSTVLAGGSLAGNDSSIVSSSLSSAEDLSGGDDTVKFRVSPSRDRYKRERSRSTP